MMAFLCMATIYLIWGSTFLAMRVGVMPGNGFPPFILAGSRLLLAGPILLLIAKLRGHSIKLSLTDARDAFISGVLLWSCGHILTLYGEQYVDSGYAALICSSTPMWVLLMESFLDKKYPDIYHSIFILFGVVGITFLVYPKINAGVHTDALGALLIVIGAISWGAGALYQQRTPTKLSTVTRSGYQQLFAGAVLVILSLSAGEPMPHPTLSAWLAWGYLVIFGSIIAFTTYVKALKILPISIVMTNSYVNSIVAVTLGCLILGEKITPTVLIGGVIVIAAVFGIIMRKKIRHA